MTSAAQNLTHLTGRVIARRPHPSVPRWDQLTIEVAAADPVEGERNMLSESVGTRLTVVANRDELPAGELTDWEFAGQVRVAGPDVVEVLPRAAGAPPVSLTPPAGGAAHPGASPDQGSDGDGGPVPVL